MYANYVLLPVSSNDVQGQGSLDAGSCSMGQPRLSQH
jgi:hypothetical protein